jgi:hypothetical protein
MNLESFEKLASFRSETNSYTEKSADPPNKGFRKRILVPSSDLSQEVEKPFVVEKNLKLPYDSSVSYFHPKSEAVSPNIAYINSLKIPES